MPDVIAVNTGGATCTLVDIDIWITEPQASVDPLMMNAGQPSRAFRRFVSLPFTRRSSTFRTFSEWRCCGDYAYRSAIGIDGANFTPRAPTLGERNAPLVI